MHCVAAAATPPTPWPHCFSFSSSHAKFSFSLLCIRRRKVNIWACNLAMKSWQWQRKRQWKTRVEWSRHCKYELLVCVADDSSANIHIHTHTEEKERENSDKTAPLFLSTSAAVARISFSCRRRESYSAGARSLWPLPGFSSFVYYQRCAGGAGFTFPFLLASNSFRELGGRQT